MPPFGPVRPQGWSPVDFRMSGASGAETHSCSRHSRSCYTSLNTSLDARRSPCRRPAAKRPGVPSGGLAGIVAAQTQACWRPGG